jgi:hypothetical protein
MNAAGAVLLAALLSCAGHALARAEDKEPVAVAEVGAAGEAGLKGGSAFGPSVAVEVTPIEHWLELEGGVSTLLRKRQTEWDTDLLFKKPYTLSDSVEFMAGVGPQWVRVSEGGKTSDTASAEAVLDFMFWPRSKHDFGWYLEPSYTYDFGPGHEQSLGVSAGLLIAIP